MNIYLRAGGNFVVHFCIALIYLTNTMDDEQDIDSKQPNQMWSH